jgi:transposase
MARLVITAVTVEGRSRSEVARDYGVSRVWVQKLLRRYQREGPAAFEPRWRRPHSNRGQSIWRWCVTPGLCGGGSASQ